MAGHTAALLSLLLLSWPTPSLPFAARAGPTAATVQQLRHRLAPPRIAPPALMGASRGDGRRQGRIGQVVQAELATVIRTAHSLGNTRIPSGLQQMISVVDVDMSPDLRNARVKVSIIGDRKDKISAVRWLRGNVRGLRHELAQRNRHMKRIPILSFAHVDVGAATDIMVKLGELRREDEEAAISRGEASDEDDGGIDFDASDEDAWLEDDDDDDDLLFDDDEEEDDGELEEEWAKLGTR